MSTQCQHGQLARQCLNCEQAAEIEQTWAALEGVTLHRNAPLKAEPVCQCKAEIERLRQTLRDLIDLTELWFLRVVRRDMSESEYRTWHSMSYGSKAYQDAKQAALAAKGERCRQRNR